MFLLFGINLCSPGCCRMMQGSLSAVSLMFAPRDPHLTFPHLSLHKINPFLAPPRLTSLTSGPQQIKSNTHATALTDTPRVTQFFSTHFCALHFLKRLNFLLGCYSNFIGLNFLFGSGGRRICFGQFLLSVYIVCSVATDIKNYKNSI